MLCKEPDPCYYLGSGQYFDQIDQRVALSGYQRTDQYGLVPLLWPGLKVTGLNLTGFEFDWFGCQIAWSGTMQSDLGGGQLMALILPLGS
jgi:hypothetical protein